MKEVKNKKIFDVIMHILVHNSFLFTVGVMCLVHAGLLAITFISGVRPLAYFNILSVVVYLFCILLCKSGHIMPVYLSILLEVSIYAMISVYYIGWDCGAYNFLFSIVPIIIYFGSYLFKGTKRLYIVISLALNFLIYSLLYVWHFEAKPVYVLSRSANTVMLIFSSLVMFFSVIFYNAMYIYLSEIEVSSLEVKNQQLSVDAAEDALTGLWNRRGFMPRVAALMNPEDEHHFCIAFCDIDNFKHINDTYGHECGDEVLRHISSLIRREMPGCDICRWGGEEILILMKDYDFAVAVKKMEYIRKLVEDSPTTFYNKKISTTITIGLEEFNETYSEPDEIIKVADKRMYYGKQHGKNILICSGG